MVKSRIKPMVFALSLALASGGYALVGNSTGTTSATQVQPDNSQKNERDVKGGPLTPEDQSNSKADTDLTAKIRQAVVADDALSVNGKNVKIISVQGTVTLRGPVASQAEKDSIASKALQIAGAGKVVNQLEVKSN